GETFLRRPALVFEHHPAIRVARAFRDALAADERESHRTIVVCRWRGQRPSDAASASVLVREAIPVLMSRQETRGEEAARPVRFRIHARAALRDDVFERGIAGDFDGEAACDRVGCWRTTRPENDAIRDRIT